MSGEEPPIKLPGVVSADQDIKEDAIPKSEVVNYRVAPDEPRFLSIPSLSITNVRIMKVGITEQGLLDVPKNINDVAWYTGSMKPGVGAGAVLIDGHNGGVTKNGVFAHIKDLKKGAEIIIERGDGTTWHYAVHDNLSMALDEVSLQGMRDIMRSSDPEVQGLNLITCDGKWVPRLGQFDRRIMLRSVLIK